MTIRCPICHNPTMTRTDDGFRCYRNGPRVGCGHYLPRHPLAPFALPAILAIVIATACSASQISREEQVATAVGVAANSVLPVWLAAYRAEMKSAADHACTFSPSTMSADCVSRRVAAVHVVTEHWSHVRDAWQAMRLAHSAYAEALIACEGATADGGTCPMLTAASAAFFDSVSAYRCVVRAFGRPDLDPLPPPAPGCGVSAASGAP